MTAYIQPERRIPQIVGNRRRIGPGPDYGESNRDTAMDVRYFSNSNRQIRYQNLPDFDSNESDDDIEKKLQEREEITYEMSIDCLEGRCRGLIISGPGGVGKTELVNKAMEEYRSREHEVEKEITSASGYSTPVGLIKMLYKHRNQSSVLKLDDIDSIFNDEKGLNFLKIATDTTRTRVLTYETNGSIIVDGEYLPPSFEFHGSLIVCTNLDFDALIERGSKLSPHLEALMTRSNYIDWGMRTKRDYLIRVFMVADKGLFNNVLGDGGVHTPLNDKEKMDVLNFVDKYHRNLRECSLRMALKVGALRKNAKEDDNHSWERKAILTCCRGIR